MTAVVLAKNEERTIARALRSLPAGMPAFVLDAQSSDATAEIATHLGARVETRPWEGFVAARRYALSRVATPWTFMLDADEELDPALAHALLEADEEGVDGFTVRRTSWFCGRPIRRWTGESMLRVFRTDRARLEARGDVHERWVVDGPRRELAGCLAHHSYPSIEAYRRKFATYTTLEARSVRATPVTLGFVALRAVARFFGHLLLRGVLLDGWRGLYVAFWSECYPVVVHWKALRGARP